MIGSYLLAIGAARPLDDDVPATTPAPGRQLFGPVTKAYSLRALPRDKAAERAPRKRKPRR